jgi:hypothetical protein
MYGVYLWPNNTYHKVWKFEYVLKKVRLSMEFLGEFFYGAWYWYTSIKSRKNLKFKTFGWNSIQKMCFFAFV